MHGLSARNLLEAALATVVWISSLNLAHSQIVVPSSPSCSSSTKACIAARETAVESLGRTTDASGDWMVESIIDQLLHSCVDDDIELISILVPSEGRALVEPLSVMFTEDTGIVLLLSYVPFQQLTAEMLYNLNHNTSQLFDAFCFSPPGLVDLDYANRFLDLTPFVLSDPQLQWFDVIPFYRNVVTSFNNKIVGLPIVNNLMYMYYRRDTVEKYKLQIPHTWEELINVSRQMNGTVLVEGGEPSAAVCLILGNGASSFMVELMMAPVFSYEGWEKGFIIDPVTMDPLVGSKGMQMIWEQFLELKKYTYSQAYLNVFEPAAQLSGFTRGRCIFSIMNTYNFKASISSPEKGNIGMAMVPGSSKVFDRATKELVACTKEICSDSYVNKAGKKVYYNMAPMEIGGLYGAVNFQASTRRQRAAYQFLSYIASPDVSGLLNVFKPNSPVGPTYIEHLYNTPDNNYSVKELWTQIGYNTNDTEYFLQSSRRILQHPNLMPELRIQRAPTHRESINKAADTFIKNRNASIAQVMEINYQEMKSIIAASGPLKVVQKYYWDALQYTPDVPLPAPQPTSPPPAVDPNQLTRSQLAMIIVIPILVALLIVVSATWVIRGSKSRRSHNSFCDGDSLPPGDSPNTTLVVTDIESSTTLWEKLDATVMDSALTIHHAVIRDTARQHRGYESGTEGDSFTIAFHSPRSAVLFAVECQAKFVICNWPEALLKLPLCEPKYFTSLEGPLTSPDSVAQASLPTTDSLHTQPSLTLSSIFGYARKSYKNLSDNTSPPKPRINNTQSDIGAHRHQSTAGTTEFGKMSSFLPSQPALSIGLFHHSHEQQQCMSDEPFSVPAPQASGNRNCMDTMALFDNHMTVHKYITSQCKPTSGPGPGVVLLFKGLRVRMGIHAGVADASDVVRKKGRTRYTGGTLAAAKLVEEATQGAMVLLDESTKDILPIAGSDFEAVIGCMGAHKLKNGATEYVNLYQAMAPHLVLRCVFLGPPKTLGAASPSFLEAPYGQAAIVFMKAVGVDSLPPHIIEDALGVYHQTAQHELMKYGGYLAEATLDGLLLAVFPEPLSAIRWSLHTIQACKLADWSEDLLGHALGEEVRIQVGKPPPTSHERSDLSESLEIQPYASHSMLGGFPDWVDVMKVGSFSASQGQRDTPGMSAFAEAPQAFHARASGPQSCFNEAPALMSTLANTAVHLRKGWLLFRGLRIKAGIEIGDIKTDIDSLTGQMAYRGRAMNRAARIAGMTNTGMVWCSLAAWSAAHATAVSEELATHVRPGGGHEGSHTSQLRPGGELDGIHPLTRPPPHHAQWGEPLRHTYSFKRKNLAKHMSPHPEGIDEVTISEIANPKDETCFSLLHNASTTHVVAFSEEPTQVADQAQVGSAQAQSKACEVGGSAQAQSGSARVRIEFVEVKEAQPKVRSDDPVPNDHVAITSSISSEAAGKGRAPAMEVKEGQGKVVEVEEAHPDDPGGCDHVSMNSSNSSEAAGAAITLTLPLPMIEDPPEKAGERASINSTVSSKAAGAAITLTLRQPTMEDPPEKAGERASINSTVSSKASGKAITLTWCPQTMDDSSQKAMSFTTHTSESSYAQESRENVPFNDLCTIGDFFSEFPQLLACPTGPRNQSPHSSPMPRTPRVGVLGHTRFLAENSQSSLSQGSRVPPRLDVSHIPLGSFALKGIEGELELVQCCLNSNEPEPSSPTPSIPLPKLLKTYNDLSAGFSIAGSALNRASSVLVRSGENGNVRLGPNGPIRLGPNGTAERKRSVSMKTCLGTRTSIRSKTTSKQILTPRAST